MEDNEKKKTTKKHYYLEVFFFALGIYMIYSGITDEIAHKSGVSYNSKGMMYVQTGLMDAFYGILMVVGSIVSCNTKINKKP